MGEILGLTWQNVHIEDEDITADNAYIYIDKELTRASSFQHDLQIEAQPR